MKLKSLHINRGYSIGSEPGPLRGELTFLSDGDSQTELKMKLDEQLSIDIVGLCADAIVRAGTSAAKALASEGLQVKAIEHDSITEES